MNCSLCGRPLNMVNDPLSEDCGGDCLYCMAVVVEDPDCILGFIKAVAPALAYKRSV